MMQRPAGGKVRRKPTPDEIRGPEERPIGEGGDRPRSLTVIRPAFNMGNFETGGQNKHGYKSRYEIGHLTRDAEVTYTPGGMAVGKLSIA